MFQFLPQHTGDLVAVRTSGKVEKEDLDLLLPEIEDLIKRHGKISFYWEMADFHGWDPMSFLRDRFFELKHAADFKRIAIVGEKSWEHKLAQVMKPFTKAELRYFDLGAHQEALHWIQES